MRNFPKKNKKLVVIGGCGGIGESVVKEAFSNGLKVAVFDLEKSIKINPPVKGVLSFSIDATKPKELENAFLKLSKKWKGIDYLVNLVGFVGEFKTVENLSNNGWNETLDGNLKSTFLGCKLAIPYLKKGGAIVNMSSGLGVIGMPNYAAYSASKAAVISLTKTLAVELAPDIRVNAVAPGAVKTAFLSGGLGRGGKKNKKPTRVDLEAYRKMLPLKEVAKPMDIAAPILFLLSEGAKHITGQTIHINGGGLML